MAEHRQGESPRPCEDRIVLEILGIDTAEEAVYTALLSSPSMTVLQLVRGSALGSANQVEAALTSLADKGLVHRIADDPVRFVPTSPETALENLQHAREEQVRKSRALITDLTRRYRLLPGMSGDFDAVEHVVGEAALNQLNLALRSVRSECRALDTPPYAVPCDVPESEREMLARGARVRVVYDQSAINALGVHQLRTAVDLGEEARLVGELPLRLYLIDDRLALLPLKADQNPHDGTLVIRPSALLDALSQLFELLWDRAVPLKLDAGPAAVPVRTLGADGDEEALLGLLAAGLTDTAIARQLDLGLRTVQRRISTVMSRLNAKTRFQAGVILGREGRYETDAADEDQAAR